MKRYNWLILILSSLALLVASSGCSRDKLKDLNTNPSDITKPNIKYLMTEAIKRMEPLNYRPWFYDYTYMLKWGQITGTYGGNEDRINEQGIADGIGRTVYRVMSATKEIQHLVNKVYSPEEAARYRHIEAMTYPIQVYLALLDTDMYGDMAYSETFQARYTYPPLLTPKYDTQEELLNQLYEELVATTKTLSNPVLYNGKPISQTKMDKQDLIYSGDVAKWAKFANSLKLKIAVRLLHADKANAFQIAEEAFRNPAGLISTLEEDFIYNAGTKDYHFTSGVNPGTVSKQFADFLVENRDPRIRFFFEKNDYNSMVVQAFFDAQALNPKSPDLPSMVAKYVEYDEVGGKKVFKKWKEPGEPWVRYFGVPTSTKDNLKAEYKDYFDPQKNIWKIKKGDQEKTYYPLSSFNEEMLRGNLTFTFPDAPGATVVEDKQPQAWYGCYFSSAEVALYLAELKTIGANIGVNAAEQFKKGIKHSVLLYDKLARLNNIPYYKEPYDKAHGKALKLVDGEIDYLLNRPAYKLTGNRAEDLEKIYIQQHIHFTMLPADMYVSMRRSGVPMFDSKILPFVPFTTGDYPLARRFDVKEPLQSDKMYQIQLDAYKRQGYTMSTSDVSVLAKERVWYDKGAPDFGKGPNL